MIPLEKRYKIFCQEPASAHKPCEEDKSQDERLGTGLTEFVDLSAALHGAYFFLLLMPCHCKLLIINAPRLSLAEAGRKDNKTFFNTRPYACGRKPFSTRSWAICTAFVAAPLRRLSATHQRLRPYLTEGSRLIRPTKTSSFPHAKSGIG